MPAKILPLIASLSLALVSGITQAQEGPALQATLEQAYNHWRSAFLAKDARAWASAVTNYRQVMTRNLIVSQRKPFPEAVFAVPVDPPPVAGLRLLEAQAVGPTAHLLYFGKVNAGGDPAMIPDNVLMLKFFFDNGAWRFDSSKILQLRDQPELRAQLQKGGRPPFLDYPQFTPPGKVPPTPPLCKVPTHVTAGTLQSHGYETRMTINGFDYGPLADQSERLLVIGGLNDGDNEVTLFVKPTDVPAGAERLLQLDLFLAPTQTSNSGRRVLHYQSKDPNLSGTIKVPLVINQEVLSNGR